MDACQMRLLGQGILVRPLAFQLGDLPVMHAAFGLHRLIFFLSGHRNDTGSSARCQKSPDAAFVRPIPGQPAEIDPFKIPPQDRDIVVLKFCLDTNPFPTLEAAIA
eukprot:909799-Pelagomonas_calceolata.AAC.1